eukprot:TRINITY_DN5007_c0_g1_i2.p2 TRINITY_DN5007_c0_g1~~TRINITY_DN5007_c0_g1_i2.p2  ORF type:complete len:244 (-),score=91.05 TRINITY_DN5007_c0_g1_i2:43-774(-)
MLQRAGFVFGRALRETGQALERVGMRLQGDYAFVESLNRHRRLLALYDKKPLLRKDVFVAPNASLIGDVSVGAGSTVWYSSVLRGDVNTIKVGEKSSIGDNCVVHVSSASHGAFGGAASTNIGNGVVVESGSILHGCELRDGSKVGSGSVVFDGAVLEEGAVLAPGSLLTANKRVPAGQLWGGRPASFMRELTPEEKSSLARSSQDEYERAKRHEDEHKLTAEDRAKRADQELYHKPDSPAGY